jgi:hypothetical protein
MSYGRHAAAVLTCWWYQAAIMWPHQARKLATAILERWRPDEGRHSPCAAMAPAPVAEAQEPRPGDPRAATRAVRAGARTPTEPNPMTPAVPVPPSGQPDAAPIPPARQQAPSPAPTGEGAPPGRDTWVTWPQPTGAPMAPRHADTRPRLLIPGSWRETRPFEHVEDMRELSPVRPWMLLGGPITPERCAGYIKGRNLARDMGWTA